MAGSRASRQSAERAGRLAETVCALLLRLKGYAVLDRRYRAPGGEIDIVARRGNTVAFVEIKMRRTLADALEALGPAQRARIAAAAELLSKVGDGGFRRRVRSAFLRL